MREMIVESVLLVLYTSLIIIAIIAHCCADLGQETGARTGGILL